MGRAQRAKRVRRMAPAQAERPGEQRNSLPLVALPVACGLVVSLVILAAFLGDLIATESASGPRTSAPGLPRAVIVDQLSLTFPNASFIETASEILGRAGYTVDYYPGEEVTVGLYQRLPTLDYDIIILRVHSGRFQASDGLLTDDVVLFTSETYDTNGYYYEQEAGRVGWAGYTGGGRRFFGIMPEFIKETMEGRFDKTLIVMMGCDGLRSQSTAEAFLDKGAGAVVSWNNPVSASHTDATTLRFLEHLVTEGLGSSEAVSQTAAEVGPDPTYGAELRILTGG